MIRKRVAFSLVAAVTTASVIAVMAATPLWSSPDGRYFASFPSPPERITASAASAGSVGYQTVEQHREGAVIYLVSVTELPGEVPARLQRGDEASLLEASCLEFSESLGAPSSSLERARARFSDGRPMVKYALRFDYAGQPAESRGFWLFDEGRIIRVSISFLRPAKARRIREAERFLESFVITEAERR